MHSGCFFSTIRQVFFSMNRMVFFSVTSRRPRRAAPVFCVALLCGFDGVAPVAAAGDLPRPDSGISEDVIVVPRPLFTSVGYPSGATGEASVELRLHIGPSGAVTEVDIVSGVEPYATAALAAAKSWVFTPAMKNGSALPARIKFRVNFVPPHSGSGEANGTGTSAREESAASSEPPAQDEVIEVNVFAPAQATAAARLTQQEILTTPGAFGDAFRAVETLPGVLPVASGIPYFYVRGAPVNDTGFVFDGMPVPTLFHALVGPSVISPQLVQSVDVHGGPYPTRLGARAGGVIEGRSTEPRVKPLRYLSVRAVDAGGLVETPFAEGRGHITASGRYSYAGWVLSQVLDDVRIGYWDYYGRAHYDLDRDDRIQLVALGSSDQFDERPPLSPEQGSAAAPPFETTLALAFHRAELRWLRDFESGHMLTAVGLGTDALSISDNAVQGRSRELNARSQYWVELTENLVLDLGVNGAVTRVRQSVDSQYFKPPPVPDTCGVVTTSDEATSGAASQCTNEAPVYPRLGDPDYELGVANRLDTHAAAYAQLSWAVTPRLTLAPGLRADLFGSGNDAAVSADPRVQARFRVTPSLMLFNGLGIAHQRPGFPIPVPGSGPTLKGGLQSAVQHEAGAEWALPNQVATTRLTGFQNLFFDFTDGRGLPIAQQELVRSDGRAFGLELLVRKPLSGGWGGYLSYTLSRSERYRGKYSGVAANDRTHVLGAALSITPKDRWLLGVRGLVYTGQPARVVPDFGARPRTPTFWRTDLRVQRDFEFESVTGSLVLEVQNVTLNKEVVGLDCTTPGDECLPSPLGPVTIPSIGIEARL